MRACVPGGCHTVRIWVCACVCLRFFSLTLFFWKWNFISPVRNENGQLEKTTTTTTGTISSSSRSITHHRSIDRLNFEMEFDKNISHNPYFIYHSQVEKKCAPMHTHAHIQLIAKYSPAVLMQFFFVFEWSFVEKIKSHLEIVLCIKPSEVLIKKCVLIQGEEEEENKPNTYAFSWLSKWWTSSSRLSTIWTSSSSSSFSRARCSSVFSESETKAENWID